MNTLHCCVTVQKGGCAGPEPLSRLAVSIPPEALARGPDVRVRKEVHLELSTSCLRKQSHPANEGLLTLVLSSSKQGLSLRPLWLLQVKPFAQSTIAQLNYVSKNPKAMILQRDYSPAKEGRTAHKIVKGMVSMHPL